MPSSLDRLLIVIVVLGFLGACGPRTPEQELRAALRRGDVAAVSAALDGGMKATDELGGDPPLHIVAGSGMSDPALISLLIERGARVDATDEQGRTAWDIAWSPRTGKVGSKGAQMLVALLEAGFEPEDDRGDVAGPKGRGEGLLHRAAQRVESARLIELLVEKRGLPLEDRDRFGWTPLHYAAKAWNYDATIALLTLGADPNAESTETWEKTRSHRDQSEVVFRYEAGSRPLDVIDLGDKRRFDQDVRKPIREYGGEPNSEVSNEHR